MKCIIYSAPFVLKKDLYAYEKSLASHNSAIRMCTQKKQSKKKVENNTQKDELLKML